MVRVVAAGHVNWDVTLAVDRLPGPDDEALIREQHRSGGGSAANVAAALVDLDVSAGVVGCVGDDDHGRRAREELVERGVDCAGLAVREGQTTVKYLLVADDGSVAVLGNEGLNEALAPAEVPVEQVRDAEHLHLTSQPPATAAALAEVAEAAGCTVSFDPGRRAADRDFGPVLECADLVFATRREANALFGAGDRDRGSASGATQATRRDLLLVVTRGPGGACLYRDVRDDAASDAREEAAGDAREEPTTGSKRQVASDAQEQVADDADPADWGEPSLDHPGFGVATVDTSGAGDAFAAGFLSAWLDDRDDLERALEVGNACGALASRDRGARSAPRREDVEAFLAERR